MKTDHLRSSKRVFDYQDSQYGFGGGLQLATVYSEDSRLPVILNGRITYRISKWSYIPLEIFIRLQGKSKNHSI